jgi:hypothetical protein
MTAWLPNKRPDCEDILKSKNSWALNEEELKISDELREELIPKLDDENKYVFSILKSKLYQINDEFEKIIDSKESENETSDKAIKSKSKRVHNCVIRNFVRYIMGLGQKIEN